MPSGFAAGLLEPVEGSYRSSGTEDPAHIHSDREDIDIRHAYTRIFDEEEEEYVCEYLTEEDPGFGGRLERDVEGVTLYEADDDEGYVIVSSQGSNEYLVFDREDSDYVGRFAIVDGMVDGTQETDGIAVSNADFGGAFDDGLFIAMDGGNTPDVLDEEGEAIENTNFKFVRWEDIAEELDLIVDDEHDIRDQD